MRLKNNIAWTKVGAQKTIIAIGDPVEWRRIAPLPAGAVVTNLVDSSQHEPAVASELWRPFLLYLYFMTKPPWWRRMQLAMRPFGFAIPVDIEIRDRARSQAVAASILAARCGFQPTR